MNSLYLVHTRRLCLYKVYSSILTFIIYICFHLSIFEYIFPSLSLITAMPILGLPLESIDRLIFAVLLLVLHIEC